MANIGEIEKEYEVIPLEQPAEPAPAEAPAESPDRELIPAGA